MNSPLVLLSWSALSSNCSTWLIDIYHFYIFIALKTISMKNLQEKVPPFLGICSKIIPFYIFLEELNYSCVKSKGINIVQQIQSLHHTSFFKIMEFQLEIVLPTIVVFCFGFFKSLNIMSCKTLFCLTGFNFHSLC